MQAVGVCYGLLQYLAGGLRATLVASGVGARRQAGVTANEHALEMTSIAGTVELLFARATRAHE